jgi:hypothetical protein
MQHPFMVERMVALRAEELRRDALRGRLATLAADAAASPRTDGRGRGVARRRRALVGRLTRSPGVPRRVGLR